MHLLKIWLFNLITRHKKYLLLDSNWRLRQKMPKKNIMRRQRKLFIILKKKLMASIRNIKKDQKHKNKKFSIR